MLRRFFMWAVAAFAVAAVCPSCAAAGQDSAIRFVPDVEARFNALAVRVDPLGFHIGSSPNPSTCKHYQGLARVEGPDGTPYLFVTRSGPSESRPDRQRRRHHIHGQWQRPSSRSGTWRPLSPASQSGTLRARRSMSTCRRQHRAFTRLRCTGTGHDSVDGDRR